MTGGAAAPLRVGILGCSDIARRKFIPALGKTGRAVLAAVGSRNPASAALLLPGLGCPTGSYGELVSSAELDLLYVSLPNQLHEEWTLRALEGGKHVICEKPLGLSPGSVRTMTALADGKGLLLYENIMYLHHPQHRMARELVRSGKIGRIRMLRAAFGIPLPREGDFRLDPARGGGAFPDQARYPLSAALYHLQGEIGEFRGFSRDSGGLNLAMAGSAKTDAGELLTICFGFDQQYESFYEIVGERGMVRIDRAYTTPADLANRVSVTIGQRDESFTVPPSDHFRLMIEYVSDLIAGHGDFRAEHGRSLRLALLAEEMRRGCTTE